MQTAKLTHEYIHVMRRIMCIVTITLAAYFLSSGVAFSQGKTELADSGEVNFHIAADFSINVTNYMPVIEAKINGKGLYRFAVDTGCSGMMMTPTLAEQLGMPEISEIMVSDPSGRSPQKVRVYRAESIDIGALHFGDVDITESSLLSNDIDGLIGLRLFQGMLVKFDYVNRRFSLGNGVLSSDTSLAYTSMFGIPRIEIDINGVKTTVDIDSGAAPSEVSLPLSMANSLSLVGEPKVVGQGRTLGGPFDVYGATLNGEVRVNGIILTNPQLDFNSVFPNGTIGYRFLKNLIVTFDTANQRVRFEKPVAQIIDNAKMPDTPAGKMFTAFLAAFNTGDIEKMRGFHVEHGGDPSKAEQDINLFNQSGMLKLHNIIKSSDYEIEIIVQTMKTGEWLGFTMKVSATSPYRIEKLRIRPASAAEKEVDKKVSVSSSATGHLADREIASSLGAYLDELTKEDKFSGVVLIAKDGKPVFEKAYGLTNKSKNIPNDIETKFNLGSMNKMFTAVAIAQLAEAGKLSFDDKVGKYLLDYPNKQVADNVTIHQLLTHTSGLGLYWNDKYQMQKSNIRTVADYLALFADEPLLFAPGQRYQYSNSGYIVLGAIIEKVSGQNYYDYVRDHIYKPAGMKNTDAYELSQDTPNLAMGYTNASANWQPASGPRIENTSTLPNKGGPAGGGYSTAEDLLRFSIALQNNKLLSSRFTEIVTTGKVTGGPGKYGYGFGEEILNGKRIFGHNGGAQGIAADMSIFPESGYTAVVLMNYDMDLMPPVVNKIRDLILSSKES